MKVVDFILIGIILLIVAGAVFLMVHRRKKGCCSCGNCDGKSYGAAGCNGNCSCCARAEINHGKGCSDKHGVGKKVEKATIQ